MVSKRPNIVFILADDLGWNDLGASGSTFYETPHIDSIAHNGMRFTQAYASCQVCSPTRASILTGQDTPRHGITNYLGAAYGEEWRKAQRHDMMLPPPYEPGLKHDTVTFAEVLRQSGYKTFFAGKWHLGEGKDGIVPENFGFEINKGGYEAGGPRSYFAPYRNPKLEDGPPGESLPIRLGQETAKFIEDNKDEPFLAYLSFYSVHCPLQTTKARWQKFRKKALELGHDGNRFIMDRKQPVRQVQDNPIYAGVIEAMDDGVGVVLEALERAGCSENTIVVFTSDNGGVSSGDDYASSMLPLRGGKGRQWEGGIREPLFIRYPAGIKAGTVCDTPVISQDFYPTFVEMTGCQIPATQVIDGRSIASLLAGESDDELTSRDLYWHYPHYGNQGGDPSSMIRSGAWKLISYHEGDRGDELYNLMDDIGEQNDVAAENPEMVSEMKVKLDAWLKDRGALFPQPDPEFVAEDREAVFQRRATEGMARLEENHARFLDEGWEPNPDWWGSAVTQD